MEKVYIVAAKRTAIGKLVGGLTPYSPGDMGAAVIKNILGETGINPAEVDEVICGNVLSAGQMQGVARQAAINAGIPNEVPAYGIN
ncbi:MAG: acetyl-CoA C-acyltransferase, partial [Bacteroidales bacterium]